MRSRTVVPALAIVFAALQFGVASASAISYAPVENPGPVLSVSQAQLDAALTCSGKVDDATREPVLLLPGTATTPRTDFAWNYEPALTAMGIPWCAVELPGNSLRDIQVAAEYVVNGIRVLHSRSGRRIGIVGHSQGGMIGRWALRWWPDTRSMVEDLIGNAPSNHGTIVAQPFGLSCPVIGCSASIVQQQNTSAFTAALNSYQETFAGIDYTVNSSRLDEVVVPYTSQALKGPGRISNNIIQAVCPGDIAEHLAIGTYDNTAWALTLDALTHDGPADASRLDRSAVCGRLLMPGVNPLSFATDFGDAGIALGAAIAGERGSDGEPPLACYVTGSCPAGAVPAKLVTAKKCAARKRLVVHVDAVGGSRLRHVSRVTLNGRRLAVKRRAGRATSTVDLRSHAGTVVVLRVHGVTAGGKAVDRLRRYHVCGS